MRPVHTDTVHTDTVHTDTSEEFWAELRRTTQARIGLGRTGDALPTRQVLEFRAAHAAARDAVHTPLAVDDLAARVAEVGLGRPVHVLSRAADRSEYLRRPDLGRLPATEQGAVDGVDSIATDAAGSRSTATGFTAADFVEVDGTLKSSIGSARAAATRAEVGAASMSSVAGFADRRAAAVPSAPAGHGISAVPSTGADIGFVLADGLSPRALTEHGVPMLRALVAVLRERYTLAPPVIATQARVALGDHVGESLGVTTVLVLIGERPGLSVADSLGIYLTHRPRPGRADSERNCISNIHPPEGLGYERAARVAAGLIEGARRLGRSGVELKDTSVGAIGSAADALVLEAGGASV